MIDFALAQYQTGDSAVHVGVVTDGKVIDLADLSIRSGITTISDAYDRWAELLDSVRGSRLTGGVPVDSVKLLPPALRPSGIFCAGINYQDHVDNVYRKQNIPLEPSLLELGLPPWHFLKAGNTLRGHGTTIGLETDHIDWEIELAAIIGRVARNVGVDEALDYVAGYTVGIDFSARDRILRPIMPVGSPFRFDWIAQKSFEASCPLGPWLVPADQVGDPQDLDMRLTINGRVRQDSNTSHMIYSTAAQIAHLSTLITLSPGDVILTGTPAGTGIETDEFLQPGDVVTAWIERIGELTVTMAPEAHR